MKRLLKQRRDAMVANIFSRIFYDQSELNQQAFAARRDLVRAAFVVGRMSNVMNVRTGQCNVGGRNESRGKGRSKGKPRGK